MTRNNRLIMFALFLWGVGEGTWFFIRSLYLEQLGATPEEVGVVLSFAALTVAASFLPGGLLVDRLDRKHVMIAGWLSGVFAPLLMALATDWRSFLIGFSLYNLSAFVIPAINAYVSQASGGAPLERIFPIVYAGFSIGSILGPQVSRALLAVIDVRGVLIVSSALFATSTLAVSFIDPQPASRRVLPNGSPSLRASIGGALRPALAFYLSLFAIIFAMAIGIQLIPNYLGRLGWRMADVSGIGSAQAIGVTILSVAIGHLSAGRGRRGLLLAQGLVCVAMASFAFGVPAWSGFATAGYFLLGGYQTARQQAAAQVVSYVPPEYQGTGFALAETVGALGLAAASLISGVLFAIEPARPFHVALLLIPFGALLTLRLRRPRMIEARRVEAVMSDT